MRHRQTGSQVDQDPRVTYDRLEAATPAERASIVLRLIEEHPELRLELPPHDGSPAILDNIVLGRDVRKARCSRRSGSSKGIPNNSPARSLRGADLRGARLRNAGLAEVDLANADLRNAALGSADLRGATLEGADLRGADLVNAQLAGAALSGADLRGAMLEDADLRNASLRFAKLEGAAFEHADLRGADLWGADLADADLEKADMRGAILRETDFQRANLSSADLRGANCAGAHFGSAMLRGTKLQELDLSSSDISRVHLSGAWLDKTNFGRAQLGGPIGEELTGNYAEARKAYLGLERAFQNLGDHDAASWAYRRRRRMQKLDARGRARAKGGAISYQLGRAYLEYASDQLVEWVCDYGESTSRVIASLLFVYVIFTIAYGITGSVVRTVQSPSGLTTVVTRDPKDLAIFSLLAMSTSGSPAVGLQPRDESVHLLTATEALLGIGLTGLLGFVLGNRVRR